MCRNIQAAKVTDAQFHADEPSGVTQQQRDVMVDGVRGTMFFGSNDIVGDTREIWFIHNGLIYEVTAYKDLDSWLGDVMQSWTFMPLTTTTL
jgi:hypothetical protein